MDLCELFRTEADSLESVRISLWQVVGREHSGVEHWLREHVPEEGEEECQGQDNYGQLPEQGDVVGDSPDDVVVEGVDRGGYGLLPVKWRYNSTADI